MFENTEKYYHQCVLLATFVLLLTKYIFSTNYFGIEMVY